MALDALTIQHETTSFTAAAGFFYRVDASGGNVTVTLPATSATTAADWLIVKKIDSSANTVTIVPAGSDQINQTTSNVLSSQNQSHQVIPNTPAAGNLVVSAAPQSGTDSFGNSFGQGVASFDPALGVFVSLTTGVIIFNQIGASSSLQAEISEGNGIGQWLGSLASGTDTAASFDMLSAQQANDANGAEIYTPTRIVAAGSVFAANPAASKTQETWHDFSLQAGCTAGTDVNGTTYTPAYMLTNDGDVKLQGVIIIPAGGLTAGTTWGVIPAAYRPTTNIPVALIANRTVTTFTHVYIRPNGNVQFNDTIGAGTAMWIDCILNVQGT